MTFLILVAVVVIAYFAWRVVDQLPDVVYRLSEIQRDVADLRRQFDDGSAAAEEADPANAKPGPTPDPDPASDATDE